MHLSLILHASCIRLRCNKHALLFLLLLILRSGHTFLLFHYHSMNRGNILYPLRRTRRGGSNSFCFIIKDPKCVRREHLAAPAAIEKGPTHLSQCLGPIEMRRAWFKRIVIRWTILLKLARPLDVTFPRSLDVNRTKINCGLSTPYELVAILDWCKKKKR